MWREENGKEPLDEPKGSDLRSVGVSVSDVETDEQTGEEMAAPPEEAGGPEVAGPVSAAPAGGAPAGAEAPATPGSPPA